MMSLTGEEDGAGSNANPASQEHALDTLVSNGIQLLEDGDLESALQFATRSLEVWGKNPKSLELLAIIQLESGDREGARKLFEEIIELTAPSGWAPAHMSLGQLTTGKEAAAHYHGGIRLYLERVKDPTLSRGEMLDLQRKISSGFVSLTELYLTDLCYEEDAESNCENFLKQALQIDPQNPEIYQALASVRLSQQRVDDAKAALITSFEFWHGKEDVVPPPYPARLALSRMMLEAELFESALQVLEHLELEDDKSVDVWYLYGLVNYLLATASNKETDLELCKESWGCLAMALQLAERQEYGEPEVLEHIEEIKRQLLTLDPSLAHCNLDEEEEDSQGAFDFPSTDDESNLDGAME